MKHIWRFFKRRSIRAKIFISFFLVAVIFAMLIVLWTSHVMKREVEYRFIDSLHNHQLTIVHEIEDIESSLRFIGRFMADMEKLSSQLVNNKTGRSIWVYTINFLRSHDMFCYLPGSAGYSDKAHEELIQKGRMGLYSSMITERVTDGKVELSIDAVNPIETPEGVNDVVIVSYPITQKILYGLKIRTGADISLIYNDQIVISTLKDFKAFQVDFNKTKEFLTVLDEEKAYLTEWGAGSNTHKVLVFPLVINYKPWGFFAVSLPFKRVLEIRQDVYTYTIGFALILLAVIGFIYNIISRKLIQPVKQLSIAADYVSRGDLSQRVRISAIDEVGHLQQSFNFMAENLQRTHNELMKSNEKVAEWSRTLELKVEERAGKLHEVQQQLYQVEKLSAIGEMVSGVAHEINNPLSTIIGFAQIMEMNISDDQARKDLNKIAHEARRASKIVKNLLTYARKEGPGKQLTQINDLITQTIELRAYELRTKDIGFTQDLDPALEDTMVDPNQIKQVLLNVINNAMVVVEGKKDKAKIEISTHQYGGQIIIEISDNGPGITKEIMPKIFDPFFTTKEVGKGTGLGLSVSYGIIKAHGGTIEVETEAGKGCTFIVTLPLVKQNQAAAEEGKPEDDNNVLLGKRVLVVDDEVDVLNYMRRFLKSCGCIVSTASDGSIALEKLQQDDFDLIVCDIRMPVMDGKALYDRLSVKMPRMLDRIVFATGDFVSPDTIHFIKSTGAEYVTKPFELSVLKNVLCKVIH